MATLGSVYNAQEIANYVEEQMNTRFAGNQSILDSRMETAANIVGQSAVHAQGMDVKVQQITAAIKDAHNRIGERLTEIIGVNKKVDNLYTMTDEQLKQAAKNLQELDITNKATLDVLTSQLQDKFTEMQTANAEATKVIQEELK